MGLRGRRLVEGKYSWRAIAERVAEVLIEIAKKNDLK